MDLNSNRLYDHICHQENKICIWRLPPSQVDKGAFYQDTSIADGGPGDALERLDAEPQLLCEERHVGDVTDIKVWLGGVVGSGGVLLD